VTVTVTSDTLRGVSDQPEKQTTIQIPAKRKAPRTAYKPGQSGNPKGRPPKGQTEAERTREFLDQIDPTSGKTHGELVREVKLRLALAGDIRAIESLETRAYGKPLDTLKIESDAQPEPGYMALIASYVDRGVSIDTTAATIAALNSGPENLDE
jgi:hypothetical protein